MRFEAAFLVWLLFAVVYDFRQRRIPNWLVLAGAIGALFALTVWPAPLAGSWNSAVRCDVLGLGFLLVFHFLGIMGAYDVK